MDTFKIAMGQKVYLACEVLFTLTIIVGGIAIINTGVYELSDAGPFIFLGLFAWMAYDAYKFVKMVKYSVSVSEEGIKINNDYLEWGMLKSAQLTGALMGMKPAIILTTHDNIQFKIPAAIKGRDYIIALVEKHVKNISKGK